MNQKLSDWASVAEIVSGVAVVVTLIFLVLGIRENSEITRAVAYERNVDSRNEWRMCVSEDDERLRIYQAFLAGQIDDLNDLAIDRLGFILDAIWSINEKTYYSNQRNRAAKDGTAPCFNTNSSLLVVVGRHLSGDDCRGRGVGCVLALRERGT